ncbi:peptidoglycan-binding domain-containing protein [Bradyrhizobium sp.]|uniref:peptidoglycan-binding domain-containing protein n=1 Tax=Bradyrhizobium sp. TaxID=376 RepID=UPI0025BD1B3A|nr:peptidoglycan-binding domain-containing protein [Bradyrhizobium sp.]
MPRRPTNDDDDDETPRRRNRPAAAGAAPEAKRGLAMRLFLRSPKDVVAGVLACAAITAIVTNALFLQAGPHPAPMFGSFVISSANSAAIANLLPRPRPAEADGAEPKLADPRPAEPKLAEPKSADQLANLVRSSTTGSVSSGNVTRPPASIPVSPHGDTGQVTGSRRVAAVQRALTEYGYGQLKPTGTIGVDTQAAIQKFERERKLPVTGQISERMVRELASVIGHPVD